MLDLVHRGHAHRGPGPGPASATGVTTMSSPPLTAKPPGEDEGPLLLHLVSRRDGGA